MGPPRLGGAAARALLALTTLAGGCGDPAAAHTAAAAEVFERFQDCLLAGDRPALRPLLSAASRVFVDDLPLERAFGKQRLSIVRAESRPPQVLLIVRDPNDGDRERTFVLVREDGRLKIDLLATTAFNHEQRAGPEAGLHFEPQPPSAAELARIRSLPEAAFR